MAKKYIDTDTAYEVLSEYYHQKTEVQHAALREALSRVPAADVVEVNAFRNEVYRYIDVYKNDGADFLAGLETAVVIAEKMAGVYEGVEE